MAPEDETMTVCPIAIAVHCTGCPIVKVCPARTVLGDYARHPPREAPAKPEPTKRKEG